jgi:hypothetical protein
MSAETVDNKKWWLMTLVSLAFTVALLVFIPQWFWVGLPFLFTSFVKAMDWM